MPFFAAERDIIRQQIQQRLKEIWEHVYTDRRPIDGIQHVVTGKGLGPERAPKRGWKPFAAGQQWGGYDETTWFRMRPQVPKAWKGQSVVAFIRATGSIYTEGLEQLSAPGESLLYIDGVPRQGLDINHDEVHLTPKAKGGERYEFLIEAVPSVRFDAKHLFHYADLAVFHPEAWDCYWDFLVPLKVYQELDDNSVQSRRLLEILQEGIRKVDLVHRHTDACYASCKKASAWLRKALKELPSEPGMGKLVLTGHSHIDTAWLWPLRESRRKVGRTFSTALDLMDRYPDYHFSFSQPELYWYCKEHYPEIWKRLKQRVKEGRWEVCGAPWVEPDTNMPSGEALVRQFVYGNRFFRKELGVHTRTAWLPDAFGYTWTMPQIMKQAQLDTFVTSKIDWSLYTKFPYNFFHWQGLDGTRIHAVMPPLNYNGNPIPADAREQWKRFQQKELADEIVFPFGFGDGGGGPTMEMLEHGKRLGDITGIPQCEFGRNQDSLDRMVYHCPDEDLPVWNNELYLELHRGCQTSQARTKRHNRKTECLLHDAEMVAACAHLHGGKYGHDALFLSWRRLMTLQFHDILPGSSINEVYHETERDYAEAQAAAGGVLDTGLGHLAKKIDTRGEGEAVVVFNTLSWLRADVVQAKVKLPANGKFHVVAPDGTVVASQKIGKDEILFEAYDLPPMGYAVYRVVSGEAPTEFPGLLKSSKTSLENAFLKIKFDQWGHFRSVYDKVEEREVLEPKGKGNVILLYDDRPHEHDAWDIDPNYAEEKCWHPSDAKKITVVEDGPVRAVVRLERETEHSTITEDLILYNMHPRVDVKLDVDWQDRRTLMKVQFPVAIHSHRASYHIQFGVIERPTHDSTAYDRARSEVTGQHWADLSEGDYGVSLLNDCKYGYDIKGNTMKLSLLRAPEMPDPEADRGFNTMTYSLYPHGGDWRYGTVQHGHQLNLPPIAHAAKSSKGELPPAHSFAAIDADHVIIDTIKKAEDSDHLVIRFYETNGQRGPAMLHLPSKPNKVYSCDLMEENDQPLKTNGAAIPLTFRPWEIKTLKVKLRES